MSILIKEAKDATESKLISLAEETGQIIRTGLYPDGLQIVGTYFSSYFNAYDGTWSTTPLYTNTDMPETLDEVESAIEKAEEMSRAKQDWEELLVKINDALEEWAK